MVRTIGFLAMLIATPAGSAVVRAQSGSDVRPSRYELVINGERFEIEANRHSRLACNRDVVGHVFLHQTHRGNMSVLPVGFGIVIFPL